MGTKVDGGKLTVSTGEIVHTGTTKQDMGMPEEKITKGRGSLSIKHYLIAVVAATLLGSGVYLVYDSLRKKPESVINQEIYRDSEYSFSVNRIDDDITGYTIEPQKSWIGKAEKYPQLSYSHGTRTRGTINLKLSAVITLYDFDYGVDSKVVNLIEQDNELIYRADAAYKQKTTDFDLADKVMKHYVKEMRQEEAHKIFLGIAGANKTLKDYARELGYSEPEPAKH